MTLLLSACLKTRAQLKNDSPDDNGAPSAEASKPQPGQVQSVQPQGQYAMDEIRSEMTRVEGRVEDLERAKKESEAGTGINASKDDLKKLEQRIGELEQAQTNMLEALKKIQDTPAVSANPEDSFNQGKNAFEAGNYDEAIKNFDAYLKVPKVTHTQEATFLRGESFFSKKEYKRAIVDYSKFPEKYTTSKRMPQALYKIGMSFEALGMKEDAKGFYQELVEKYPKAPEAKRVRNRIK